MDFKGYELTPQRQELLTDILCSITKSRMILLDACNLLCYDKIAPDNILRRSFFYSDQKAFIPFVDRLYTKFLRKPGQQLAPFIKKKIGIIAECSTTDSNKMLAIHIDKNNRFNLSERQGSAQLSFMAYSKTERNAKRLIMGRNSKLFTDITIRKAFKTSPSYPMMYAVETLLHTTACLQSMASLFTCFMTDEIGDIDMIIPEKMWDTQSNAKKKFHSPLVERAVRSAVTDAVFSIRDLFRSKDGGEVPDVTIDRNLLSLLVKEQERAAIKDQKKDFHKRTKSSAGICRLLQKESLRAPTAQLESRCGMLGSNNIDSYSAIYSTVIPDFTHALPKRPSTGIPYGTLHLGMWQKSGMVDIEAGSMTGTTYDGLSYNLQAPYTRYSFIFQILRLLDTLRYFGEDTLEEIKSSLRFAEDQASTVYRFMNATRAVCTMDLLLANV